MNEINWKTTKKEIPNIGKRIAIKLLDGRVCSGKVTDTGGIHLEYVDNLDLLANAEREIEWLYLD